MRLFMTKRFDKFAQDEGIEIDSLIKLVQNIETGANAGQWSDLGGGVFKARVARKGEGSSGGYRVITLLRHQDKAFLVGAYAKNAKSNLSKTELQEFKLKAKDYLSLSIDQINTQLALGLLREIENGI